MTKQISKLIELLKSRKLKITAAESCTGGSLSSLLTKFAGASAYFDRGYIVYSNQAKIDDLKVDAKIIKKFGAVSDVVALEMAKGALNNSKADIAVAITGIAGPEGKTANKPVGTVCFAFIFQGKKSQYTKFFLGSREQVISKSIDFVLTTLLQYLEDHR